MKRLIPAAIALALLTGPAFAQGINWLPEEKRREPTEEEKKQEKAYRATMQKMQDKGPVDPWGTVRSAEQPQRTTQKPAPKPQR